MLHVMSIRSVEILTHLIVIGGRAVSLVCAAANSVVVRSLLVPTAASDELAALTG